MRKVVENAKTDGDDAIFGFYFEDRIDGGKGDDYLVGGDLNDTYVYGGGYGQDVIEDNLEDFLSPSYDILEFADGLKPSDFDFLRDGASATITLAVKGANDRLTLKNQFELTSTVLFGDYYYDNVDELRFADGTVWDMDAFGRALLAQARTDGDDAIYGFDKRDTLDGGLGDDRLEGGVYSDTYIYRAGYGDDTIFDATWDAFLAAGYDSLNMEGINFDDVRISRFKENLIFTLEATGETVTLEHQYNRYDGQVNAIEQLVFADQTILYTDLNPEDVDLVGTNASETLWGTRFAETIDGRGGDDTLIGSSDGDTYKFDVGYGADVIIDKLEDAGWNADDTVLLGADITIQNAVFTKDANDLVVSITGRTDTLRIKEQFGSHLMGVEWFKFADGTRWHITDIEELLAISGGGRGDDVIVGLPDRENVLDGRQGDDQLSGGAYADTYVFDGGYGIDIVTEALDLASVAGAKDRVVFGELITRDNLIVRRSGADLVFSVKGAADQLRIVDGLTTRQVERFLFADGSVWTTEDVVTALLRGADGDDVLIGFDTRDDVLDGARGSDQLEGGLGADTYHFDLGSGADSVLDALGAADRIVFGPRIFAQMLDFGVDGDNLVIRVSGFEDSLVVLDTLGFEDDARRIETLQFADGSTMGFDAIRQRLRR